MSTPDEDKAIVVDVSWMYRWDDVPQMKKAKLKCHEKLGGISLPDGHREVRHAGWVHRDLILRVSWGGYICWVAFCVHLVDVYCTQRYDRSSVREKACQSKSAMVHPVRFYRHLVYMLMITVSRAPRMWSSIPDHSCLSYYLHSFHLSCYLSSFWKVRPVDVGKVAALNACRTSFHLLKKNHLHFQ